MTGFVFCRMMELPAVYPKPVRPVIPETQLSLAVSPVYPCNTANLFNEESTYVTHCDITQRA